MFGCHREFESTSSLRDFQAEGGTAEATVLRGENACSAVPAEGAAHQSAISGSGKEQRSLEDQLELGAFLKRYLLPESCRDHIRRSRSRRRSHGRFLLVLGDHSRRGPYQSAGRRGLQRLLPLDGARFDFSFAVVV